MMRHYLTYQHNVQKYFREHSDKYDGVVIPLSIATAFPSGTYGFIRALCSRHADTQYAIDPRNALFQKQWDRTNVRPPHEKMAGVLGEPYLSKGLSRPLDPGDFDDESVLQEHVRLCLEFQKQFRLRSDDERKLEKYKTLLGMKSLTSLKQPQFLIPPYYQFSAIGDPWYDVSIRSTDASLAYHDGIPVRPAIHFSRWEDIPDWSACLSALTRADIEEFWFYPNNFKEHDAMSEELTAYRKAVEDAASRGLRPFALFGGYFAALLSYAGLAGFGNGVGYGEWRDSGYHRGGTAATRIYLLKLHRYLDAPKAQDLIDRDPEYFGGDSEIVAGYVDSGDSVVDMSQAEALDHFMECRKQELDFVQSESLDAAMAELEETTSRLKEIGPQEAESFGKSLTNWREAMA